MAGCLLRASGLNFDVESFLKGSALRPAVVYKKGQRRRPASRGPQTASGFNAVVSAREDSLESQVAEALSFVRTNTAELQRLRKFPGVDEVVLDFACPQGEIATRSARFPAELLATAGGLGVDIHLSFYLVG